MASIPLGFHCSQIPIHIPVLLQPDPGVHVVCIGSAQEIPEAVCPLIGSMLQGAGLEVAGTIHEPVLDDGLWASCPKPVLLVRFAHQEGVQPGFLELERTGDRCWSLSVYMDQRFARYSEVVQVARDTASVILALLNLPRPQHLQAFLERR